MKVTNLQHFPRSIPEALLRFENSDKIALICGGEKLSYKQLLADAQYVAHVLMAQGISNGDSVILNMNRSADYLRIYLGVIFAGGIQVTLHSGWPKSYCDNVISDCSPKLIVDNETARKILSTHLSEKDAICSFPKLNGEDPFQIVYTSGSTGIPKGAVNFHQNIIDWFMYKKDFDNIDSSIKYFVDKCQCILLDSNLAFVASTFQIFYALINEKMIAFATDDELKTPKKLAKCIRCTNADSILGMTSRYYQYLEEPDFADVISKIRLIILGGELSNLKVLDTFLKVSDATLYDSYGMSEICCVYTTLYRKGEEVLFSPLDYPNPIYVLDQEGTDIVPRGSVGEMCIGGFSGKLGRYWNFPEMTAKKYVEHPKYGRIFHTGDMARLESDGRMRILGRLDGMTKLHGQRIELGAIERAMEAFSGIHRAAAKIQGEGSKAVLCGYYSGTVEQSELRRKLAKDLPYYMVPTLLQELPELPLNFNGKLNRLALPPIQINKGQYVPPKSEKEKLLCDIFAKVLKLQKPVGIDDNFFELGGDSIRGMVASALLKEHGFEMKMEWLFAVPTVRTLAPMLLPSKTEEDSNETLWSTELTDTEREVIDSTVGLDNIESVYPVIRETRFLIKNGEPSLVVDMFLINEALTEEELRRRLAESVRCHQVLRSVFINKENTRPLQVVLKYCEIPVFSVDLRRLASLDENVEKLSDAQIQYLNNLKHLFYKKPYSLSKVNFEVGLVRISNSQSVLVLVFSHLLLDGAGEYPIIQEIVYGIPAKSDVLQYNRYLKLILSDSYKEESRKIWLKAIDGRPLITELPHSSGTEKGINRRQFIAGIAFAKKAAQYCLNMHITLSALTCMALGRTLIKLCDREEVGFISIHSGRNAENGELTGMFATGIPIYVKKGDRLVSVQEQLVKGVNRPLPDLDELNLGLDNPNSGIHINLSMQTYLKTPKLELPYIPGLAELQYNYSTHNPVPSKTLKIMVTPEPSFNFFIIYDGRVIGADLVNRIGRQFLTELRHIVESYD